MAMTLRGQGEPTPLDAERKAAVIDVEGVAAMVAGSKERLSKQREIRGIIEADKAMSVDDYYFCDRMKKYERALEKTVRFVQLVRMNGWKDNDAIYARRCIREQLPVGLHWVRDIAAILCLVWRAAWKGKGGEAVSAASDAIPIALAGLIHHDRSNTQKKHFYPPSLNFCVFVFVCVCLCL